MDAYKNGTIISFWHYHKTRLGLINTVREHAAVGVRPVSFYCFWYDRVLPTTGGRAWNGTNESTDCNGRRELLKRRWCRFRDDLAPVRRLTYRPLSPGPTRKCRCGRSNKRNKHIFFFRLQNVFLIIVERFIRFVSFYFILDPLGGPKNAFRFYTIRRV